MSSMKESKPDGYYWPVCKGLLDSTVRYGGKPLLAIAGVRPDVFAGIWLIAAGLIPSGAIVFVFWIFPLLHYIAARFTKRDFYFLEWELGKRCRRGKRGGRWAA